jgi:hypothetical protein
MDAPQLCSFLGLFFGQAAPFCILLLKESGREPWSGRDRGSSCSVFPDNGSRGGPTDARGEIGPKDVQIIPMQPGAWSYRLGICHQIHAWDLSPGYPLYYRWI